MTSIWPLQAINNIDDDILDELLASFDNRKSASEAPAKRRVKWKPALLLAAIIAIMTLGASAAVLTSAGWWASKEPHPTDEQLILEAYLSENAGLIAEDDDLRVEAAGSLKDGNSLMIGILVTLKQLDSAVLEDSQFPIPGYFFGSWNLSGLNGDRAFDCSYWDTIPYLQENQFLFRCTIHGDEPLPDEMTAEFSDIGYIAENGGFSVYREGTWRWIFHFDHNPDRDRLQPDIPGRITVGQREYEVEAADLSMFGIELTLRPTDDSAFDARAGLLEQGEKMLGELVEAFSDIEILFKDGTEYKITTPSVWTGISSDRCSLDGTFRVSARFASPTPIELIGQIQLLGGDVRLICEG